MLLLWYALKWPLGAYASSARSSHWYHQHVQWGGTRWHAVTLVQCNWCSGMSCTYQRCCSMGTPKCDPAGNADPGIPRGRVGPLEMANSGRFQPFVFHVCRRTDPFSWAVQACDKGLLSYILWNFSRTFHGIAVLAMCSFSTNWRSNVSILPDGTRVSQTEDAEGTEARRRDVKIVKCQSRQLCLLTWSRRNDAKCKHCLRYPKMVVGLLN